ncbi:MAG TPA: SpoIIE family protein phosphatase [Candidatus Dormibacteraeota bacterium]|nr:SpoIIE family protein phosphatase [Candidatus Dormibacteraeota bacterium]
MHQNPAEVMEWHIFETGNTTPGTTPHPLFHMGPFSTEEECRVVLGGLENLLGGRHGNLEVRQQARRREKRIRIKVAITIARLACSDKAWAGHTVDISAMGARIVNSGEPLKLGEFVDIRYGERQAAFRVAWIGLPGSPNAGQLGIECLTPEANVWDLDLSHRTDDEPLMQEIMVARAVQRWLFPRIKPRLRTLDYSGKCVQALTVGGDYYDFLDLGAGHLGFVLADVAGKGVAAALLMANLQGNIHNRSGIDPRDLPAILSALNHHLYEHSEANRYATLFFGCYDDDARSLAYVNCGHSPPLLLRHHGGVDRLVATATVLGLFGSWDCSVGRTHMDPGDVLSIFSDGVTEAASSSGEEFGELRLLSVLEQSRGLESAGILRSVEHAVEEFRAGEHPQDDLTLVVARAQ